MSLSARNTNHDSALFRNYCFGFVFHFSDTETPVSEVFERAWQVDISTPKSAGYLGCRFCFRGYRMGSRSKRFGYRTLIGTGFSDLSPSRYRQQRGSSWVLTPRVFRHVDKRVYCHSALGYFRHKPYSPIRGLCSRACYWGHICKHPTAPSLLRVERVGKPGPVSR